MSEPVTIESVKGARRVAMGVDLAAVAASTAANIAAAPATLGGWAIAVVAPVGLFLTIVLWHRSQGILDGWIARGFNVGLAAIAGGAAWISYGHLRHVAEAMGQSPEASAIIPLVVDGAAVLASLIVVGAGQKITELTEAAGAEQRAEREAARAAEQTKREEAETERRQAATDQAEAEERKAALAARQAVVAAGPKRTKKTKTVKPSSADTAAAIAAYLIDHPEATAAAVGEAIGATARTVRRYSEWTGRPAANTTEKQEEVAA